MKLVVRIKDSIRELKPIEDLVKLLDLEGYTVSYDGDLSLSDELVMGVRSESVPMVIDELEFKSYLNKSKSGNLLVMTSICKDSIIVRGRSSEVYKYLDHRKVEVSETCTFAMYPINVELPESPDSYRKVKTILSSSVSHRRLIDYLATPFMSNKCGGEIAQMISTLSGLSERDVSTVIELLSPAVASLILDKWETSDGGDLSQQIVEVGDLGYAFFDEESVTITTRLGGAREGSLKYLRGLDSKARNFLTTKLAKELLESIAGGES